MIRELGLDCRLVRTRGELMILPAGMTKGAALLEALGDLGNVVFGGSGQPDEEARLPTACHGDRHADRALPVHPELCEQPATEVVIFCYDYAMDDPAKSQPGLGADDDLSAEPASRFVAGAGLIVDSAGGARVVGHIDLGPDHHTPWGVVHGGVYTTAVESAASIGASLAVRDRGQFAVGVHNATDFLRPATSGRAEVMAEPLQQGRVQQLWLVTITDEHGRALARGQLRLQNVPLPGAGTT